MRGALIKILFQCLDSLIEEEECPDLLADFEVLKKRAFSARKVLSMISAKGLTSPATMQCYSEELVWLARAPVVKNPMPVYFQEIAHGSLSAEAWPPAEFWAMLADFKVLEICVQSELEEKQVPPLNDWCSNGITIAFKVKARSKSVCTYR